MVWQWYLAVSGISNIKGNFMRVLVIGSGGREHALVWKLKQSPKVKEIFALPGNPGIKEIAQLVDIKIDELDKILSFAQKEQIDLTVVGPEVPLTNGIADMFAQKGLKLFGPSKKAAEIESSKAFAKDLMKKYNIPTAHYQVCEDAKSAKDYIKEKGVPIVVKADGLAAGKGVIVAMTMTEALDAVDSIMDGVEFGNAGARVVIEEYLEGEETSILAFSDGTTVVPMVPAQDHKRVFDGDEGPNTGGMGAYAPAPVADEYVQNEALEKVFKPVLKAMQQEGRLYQGCLYAGLIVTKEGIKVIEFNARFGDPETQVVLPLLNGDLAEIMLACINGTLDKVSIQWSSEAAVCIILASGGYPGKYVADVEVKGLLEAGEISNVTIFHAGTKVKEEHIVTAGGRVLGITALDNNIKNAQERAYSAVEKLSFQNMHYRKDIAWRAMNKQ